MNTSSITLDSLASDLGKLQRDTQVPGLAVAIRFGDRQLVSVAGCRAMDAEAPLDPDARFQIGCITKLLASLIAATLIHEKKIAGDAPITEYLAELRGNPRSHNIQVQHLLTHTSGYCGLDISDPGVGYYYSWDRFVEYISHAPQVFRPGTVFRYEHSEHVLLGEIIQRVTGFSVLALIRERLLDPLQVTPGSIDGDALQPADQVAEHSREARTGRFTKLRSKPLCPFWHPSLAPMTLSAPALLRVAELFLQAPSGRATSILGAEVIDLLHRQYVAIPETVGGPMREQLPISFGFGTARYLGALYGHNGSSRGHTCALRFDAARTLAMVVALNSWQPALRDAICSSLLSGLPSASTLATLCLDSRGKPFTEAELLGRYQGSIAATMATVEQSEGALRCVIECGRHRIDMRLRLDEDGRLHLLSNAGHLSVGLFREPDSQVPCLFVGMNAFRKAISTSQEV